MSKLQLTFTAWYFHLKCPCGYDKIIPRDFHVYSAEARARKLHSKLGLKHANCVKGEQNDL